MTFINQNGKDIQERHAHMKKKNDPNLTRRQTMGSPDEVKVAMLSIKGTPPFVTTAA